MPGRVAGYRRAVVTIKREDGYVLSSDPERVDVDLVHRWLSTDAYWAVGRPREVLSRAIAGSLVFGVYRPDGGVQVAFARVVTDRATFAYLCDVYVDRAERGRGLGTWMAGAIRDDLAERGVRRIMLATADAHGVYAKIGFVAIAEPDRLMELYPRG
ncbi:GNAT family N-acetyltransferase [Phytohabitans rumicis]